MQVRKQQLELDMEQQTGSKLGKGIRQGYMKVKSESEVAQSCLTLHDSMDCSLPGSSVHGIFQARVLQWVAIALSTAVKLRTTFPRFLLSRVWLDPANERHLCELWNSGPGV